MHNNNSVISISDIQQGNIKAIARAISLIESGAADFGKTLAEIDLSDAKLIGVTGPPGAGKSTLADALIGAFRKEEKKIAVLCVDPSSPFSGGALLGDRVRMSKWYNDSNVFIRSFSTRGSLGGLHPKIIEITELLKAAPFDYIIVETVGVGQSEVEIAGLADITMVVLVPEAGDDIQAMKSGLMEIADIFVVNKCDRPEAEQFIAHLQQMRRHSAVHKNVPVVKTIATEKIGIHELSDILRDNLTVTHNRKIKLTTEKAYQLILHQKMKHINKDELENKIEQALKKEGFNLYQFVEQFY